MISFINISGIKAPYPSPFFLMVPYKDGGNGASNRNTCVPIFTTFYKFNFCARFLTPRIASSIILIYQNNQFKKGFQRRHEQFPKKRSYLPKRSYVTFFQASLVVGMNRYENDSDSILFPYRSEAPLACKAR